MNTNAMTDAPITSLSTGYGLSPPRLLAQPYVLSSSLTQANGLQLSCAPL